VGLPIHQILTKTGRSFLVEHRGILTLVDTGQHGSATRLFRALDRVGRRPEDLRTVVLTHFHGDHTGEAARLKEFTGVTVVAGAADAGVIEGREPYRRHASAVAHALYDIRLHRFPRVAVDHAASDRTEVDGGLQVLPAPGHTEGHVVVWAADHRALLAGDAVWNIGSLRPSWRIFTRDYDRNLETLRELAELHPETLWMGHGAPVRRDAADRLRSLVV
jgi:glyoxylase-like metal-dependent hydrolase (beta-lactamase superfamily II)